MADNEDGKSSGIVGGVIAGAGTAVVAPRLTQMLNDRKLSDEAKKHLEKGASKEARDAAVAEFKKKYTGEKAAETYTAEIEALAKKTADDAILEAADKEALVKEFIEKGKDGASKEAVAKAEEIGKKAVENAGKENAALAAFAKDSKNTKAVFEAGEKIAGEAGAAEVEKALAGKMLKSDLAKKISEKAAEDWTKAATKPAGIASAEEAGKKAVQAAEEAVFKSAKGVKEAGFFGKSYAAFKGASTGTKIGLGVAVAAAAIGTKMFLAGRSERKWTEREADRQAAAQTAQPAR
ncbi:MAG: hypothetical protein LW823_07280 [Rickettsiales bacterium]|jgi:hypothetical protein|nr:hypothetical protein [Rickettsiales bacterium]